MDVYFTMNKQHKTLAKKALDVTGISGEKDGDRYKW
jgi:hypothetical protein